MAVLGVFGVGMGVFEAEDLNAIVREGRNSTVFAEKPFFGRFSTLLRWKLIETKRLHRKTGREFWGLLNTSRTPRIFYRPIKGRSIYEIDIMWGWGRFLAVFGTKL